MARGYRFTPARRRALAKARRIRIRHQLAIPNKKRVKSSVRTKYKGGVTYRTEVKRTLIPGLHTIDTKAYRKGKLYGFAESNIGRKDLKIYSVYAGKPYRGTGVAQELVRNQLYYARKYKRPVTVTGARTIGGDKLTSRFGQPRGLNATIRSNKRAGNLRESNEITQNMDFWYGFHSAERQKKYNNLLKRRSKRLKKARKKRKRR